LTINAKDGYYIFNKFLGLLGIEGVLGRPVREFNLKVLRRA